MILSATTHISSTANTFIANSGTSGSIMDMSLIPANLGVNWPERVQKWLAYKKGGIQLIDTS